MKITYHLLLLSILLISSCTAEDKNEIKSLRINEVTIQAEIADTPPKREKGLMMRENLPSDRGMLFIFEKEKKVSFWMKDTSIPLSVAYISKSGYIREIHDLQPYSKNPVPSAYSVLYALEVNRGFFKDNGIQIGDQLIFPDDLP